VGRGLRQILESAVKAAGSACQKEGETGKKRKKRLKIGAKIITDAKEHSKKYQDSKTARSPKNLNWRVHRAH